MKRNSFIVFEIYPGLVVKRVMQPTQKKSNQKSKVDNDERQALSELHANLFFGMMAFQTANPGALKVVYGPPSENQPNLSEKSKKASKKK